MLSENSQPLFAERGKRAERKMAYSLFRRCNFCTACALQIAFGSVESGTEFSLKTVVQSIHESPWLSALTANRPQSANTAVCLLGGVLRAILHETAHSGSHAEIRGTQALLAGFFSLCYFDTSTLPFYRKAGNFSAKPQLTPLNPLSL